MNVERAQADVSLTVTVAPAGEIDIATAPNLRRDIAALLEAVPLASELMIDLTEVSFMDSSAVKVIAWASTRMQQRGARTVLRNPQPEVDKLLRLLGADRLSTIEQG